MKRQIIHSTSTIKIMCETIKGLAWQNKEQALKVEKTNYFINNSRKGVEQWEMLL